MNIKEIINSDKVDFTGIFKFLNANFQKCKNEEFPSATLRKAFCIFGN